MKYLLCYIFNFTDLKRLFCIGLFNEEIRAYLKKNFEVFYLPIENDFEIDKIDQLSNESILLLDKLNKEKVDLVVCANILTKRLIEQADKLLSDYKNYTPRYLLYMITKNDVNTIHFEDLADKMRDHFKIIDVKNENDKLRYYLLEKFDYDESEGFDFNRFNLLYNELTEKKL